MFIHRFARLIRRALTVFTLLGLLACPGCRVAQPVLESQGTPSPVVLEAAVQQTAAVTQPTSTQEPSPAPAPRLRYVFVFIGDGMGENQALCVDESLAAQGLSPLCFLDLPIRGAAVTNNVHQKTTDSAAAATAIATGHKTENGMLGQTPDGNRCTSIAEALHASGMGVGILTTVSLDHATPAGFYAHTPARTNYRDICADLFISGFDYFAGGSFHDGADIPALAAEFSYAVVSSDAEADAVPQDQKLALTVSAPAADRGMPLALDADETRAGQLARNLKRGIERLSANERGFFIMTEGGRIDLCCHYHDVGALYAETLDFDLAVREAFAFYQAHPDETLLIVTADHETGGLSLSDGDRAALARQTVSCDRFDKTFTARYLEEKTSFSDALPEILSAFGLDAPTEAETATLKTAYRHTLSGDLSKAQTRERYGVYSPVASAAANLVAARAGLTFSTYGHSGVNVPVYAIGRGAEAFDGVYENTAIAEKITELVAQLGA